MNSLSSRDLIALSAFLDGQLNERERRALKSRLAADADLRSALDGLRQTRAVLRRLPQRRAPRNFTLTRQQVGQRPPLPRAVPALRLASALAGLLFVFTYAGSLLRMMPMGAAASVPVEEPMLMQAAPEAMPAVGGAAEMTATPELAAPAPFAADSGDTARAAPTPEPAPKVAPRLSAATLFRWGLAGLAVIFALAAFFLRRCSSRRWK